MRFLLTAASRLTAFLYRIQMLTQWSRRQPVYFDHWIDWYFTMPVKGDASFLDRAFHNMYAIRLNSRLLELGCGDGFYAAHFYSRFASTVICVELNDGAVRRSRAASTSNMTVVKGDFLSELPEGSFDNIVWDASIQYMDSNEQTRLLRELSDILAEDGILSGSTPEAREDGRLMLQHHKKEFSGPQELKEKLRESFSNVAVYKSSEPGRKQLYFYATNSKNVDFPVPEFALVFR